MFFKIQELIYNDYTPQNLDNKIEEYFSPINIILKLNECIIIQTGSNPAEVNGFFEDVKILSTSPLGGTLSRGCRV